MAFDVREGVCTVEGDVGVGQGGPVMEFYVGEAGASFASGPVDIGMQTPVCWFEVVSNGKAGR
jgi:hypothetical protein